MVVCMGGIREQPESIGKSCNLRADLQLNYNKGWSMYSAILYVDLQFPNCFHNVLLIILILIMMILILYEVNSEGEITSYRY